jgi:hypothetical protein
LLIWNSILFYQHDGQTTKKRQEIIFRPRLDRKKLRTSQHLLKTLVTYLLVELLLSRNGWMDVEVRFATSRETRQYLELLLLPLLMLMVLSVEEKYREVRKHG